MTEIKKNPNLNISCKSPSKSNNFGISLPNINPISRPHSPLSISINDNEISLVQPTSKSSEYPSQFEIHKIHTIRDFLDTYKSPNDETELFEFPNIDYSETSKSGSNSKSKKRKKKRKRKNIKSNSSYKLKFNRDPNVSSSDITLIKKYHQNHLHTSNKSSGIPLFGQKKYNPNLLSVSPDKVSYNNNNNNNNNNTNTTNNINNIITNNDNNKKVTFLGLSPSDSITSPCGSTVAIDCDDDKLMPRILDDGNDIEIDEEIPLENFVKAILNGGVKILTDEQKRTQYKKANRIVRAASFCNLSQFINPGIKDRTPGAQTDTNNDDIRRIKSLNNGSRSSTVDIVSINKHINGINDDTNSDSSPEPTEVKDGGPVFGVSSKSSELNKTHYVSEYSDTNTSSSSSWGTTDSDESDDTTDDSDSNDDSNDTNNDNINININEVKNVEETNPNISDINNENKNTSNINNHNKQTSLMDTLSKHIKKVRSSSINVRSSSRKKNRKYKRKIRGKSVNRKSKRKSNNNNDMYTIKETINDIDSDTEDSNSKYINDVYRNNGISLSICDISKNASNNSIKPKLKNSLSNKRTIKKRLKKHIKRRSLNCIKVSRKKNIKRKKKRRRIKPRIVDVVSNPMPV